MCIRDRTRGESPAGRHQLQQRPCPPQTTPFGVDTSVENRARPPRLSGRSSVDGHPLAAIQTINSPFTILLTRITPRHARWRVSWVLHQGARPAADRPAKGTPRSSALLAGDIRRRPVPCAMRRRPAGTAAVFGRPATPRTIGVPRLAAPLTGTNADGFRAM